MLPNDLDLNLLRTLDAVLQHRSVSEAARQLGRSQPAVSHALARLREALDDPLLVRQGRSLVPTPRAEAIEPALHAILLDLSRALDRSTTFEPARAHRTFRLSCPDVLAPVVPELLAAISDAPHCTMELSNARGVSAAAASDVVLDILPDDAPGIVARRLGSVHQAVLARRDHPALGDSPAMALSDWLAWPHVFVRTGTTGTSIVDVMLDRMDVERTIGLVVPELLLAPHVVARTDLLFTGPREALQLLTGPLDLELRDPPVDLAIPPVPVAAMWQERVSADPGHQWFRRRVIEVIEALMVR